MGNNSARFRLSSAPGHNSLSRDNAVTWRDRPHSPTATGRTLFLTALALYGATVALIEFANVDGPDRWWPAAANLYLPQWIWAIPAMLLGLTAKKFGRWCVPVCVVLLAVVIGPLMGFQWRSPQPASNSTNVGTQIRLMTYNIKWGRRNLGAILQEARVNSPDIILMQDANAPQDRIDVMQTAMVYPYWIVDGQYLVASRYPLSDAGVRSIAVDGYEFTYLRFRASISGRAVTMFDVHLYTPREGLVALASANAIGVRAFQQNVADRLYQASMVAGGAVSETDPLIVAGDFNAPMQSLVCRAISAAGLRDAFSLAGHGYGYTYGGFPTRSIAFVRIDHVFISRDWAARACWTGDSEGSEHRPVICDLALLHSPVPHRSFHVGEH